MNSTLVLKNLSKRYGDFEALKPANVEIPYGSFTSILGPSGSGKTTLLMMLAGIELPTSGEIWFGEKNLSHVELEKRNVGIVFQNYALFPHLTVRDNILYGLVKKGLSKNELDQRLGEMLELTHLSGLENRFPHELSGGQQQRVAIARALAPKPDYLLLDEPLSALDAWTRYEIGQELREIQQKSAVTTIMVTHDRTEALSLSDFILVVNHGHIEQAGTPTEVYDNPKTEFVATFVGGMNIVQNAGINHGAMTGIRYGDVVVKHATEGALSEPYTFVGQLQHIEFMGDTVRAFFLLNDFKTEVIADIPRLQPVANDLKVKNLYAVQMQPSTWRQWSL